MTVCGTTSETTRGTSTSEDAHIVRVLSKEITRSYLGELTDEEFSSIFCIIGGIPPRNGWGDEYTASLYTVEDIHGARLISTYFRSRGHLAKILCDHMGYIVWVDIPYDEEDESEE